MKFQLEPIKDSLQYKLQQAIAKAVNSVQGSTWRPEEVKLEHPAREEYGDWSTNVAMKLKVKLKNPIELAQAIVEQLKSNETMKQWSHKIQVVKPGFINISIKNEWLISQLQRVIKEKDSYGKTEIGVGKKIMVEFAHPNTHKMFHIGHLRNITTGESIVRILEAAGCQVIRANYQGDVGMHIAKCLWGIECHSRVYPERSRRESRNLYRFRVKPGMTLDEKIEFLGKCYVEGNRAYESDEKAKKEIITLNKKIYDQSDPEINKLWKDTRSWSLEYFNRIYKRVYSHFDRFYFESEVFSKGKEIVEQLLSRGKVFKKSKGAIIFPGSKYGLHDRVFINSEGNTTYEGKDMELGRLQFAEHHPDLIIHVVGPEQASYFQVIFKALEEVIPASKDKEHHLKYGWVKLKKGKMSSREGNVVLGEWLLDEVKKRIIKSFPKTGKETAETIAVGAVKYSFLKTGVDKEIAFDIEESISLEGNSGPYLQYTYARGRSVLEKASLAKGQSTRDDPGSKSIRSWIGGIVDRRNWQGGPVNPEELAILRTIYKFPEAVYQAAKEFAPNVISSYLYDLAGKYNTFYNKHSILNPRLENSSQKDLYNNKIENCSQFRLALTAATAQILKNGLNLLGIKTVEKM